MNLEGFPKLQQGGLRQFLKMFSRAVVKNAKPEVRNMVEIKEYVRARARWGVVGLVGGQSVSQSMVGGR